MKKNILAILLIALSGVLFCEKLYVTYLGIDVFLGMDINSLKRQVGPANKDEIIGTPMKDGTILCKSSWTGISCYYLVYGKESVHDYIINKIEATGIGVVDCFGYAVGNDLLPPGEYIGLNKYILSARFYQIEGTNNIEWYKVEKYDEYENLFAQIVYMLDEKAKSIKKIEIGIWSDGI